MEVDKNQFEVLCGASPEQTFEQGVPDRFLCKIVDVYDGDTCTALVSLGNILGKFNLRMYGYDSPEIKPAKNDPQAEEKKARAIEARDYLKNIVLGKVFLAERAGKDKYGRLLVRVFKIDTTVMKASAECVNDEMLKNHYGFAYFGGKKTQ